MRRKQKELMWLTWLQLGVSVCTTTLKGSSHFTAHSAFFCSGGKTATDSKLKKSKSRWSFLSANFGTIALFWHLALFCLTGEFTDLSISYYTSVNNATLYYSLAISEMQDAAHFSCRVSSTKV